MSHAAASAAHATGSVGGPAHDGAGVIELRQYTLHPGQRDTLIALFEREFVETQEACGMTPLGQFRDLDAQDRFVWLRGFADMDARARALAAFYGGPVWQAHRDAANATMLDSDDVLLLRPAHADSGFAQGGARRPAIGMAAPPARLVIAMLWPLPSQAGAEMVDPLEKHTEAWLKRAGARPLASLVSEHAKNTFPALPVREGENVYACFAGFDDDAHWRRHANDAAAFTESVPHILRLAPTARSLLRG